IRKQRNQRHHRLLALRTITQSAGGKISVCTPSHCVQTYVRKSACLSVGWASMPNNRILAPHRGQGTLGASVDFAATTFIFVHYYFGSVNLYFYPGANTLLAGLIYLPLFGKSPAICRLLAQRRHDEHIANGSNDSID